MNTKKSHERQYVLNKKTRNLGDREEEIKQYYLTVVISSCFSIFIFGQFFTSLFWKHFCDTALIPYFLIVFPCYSLTILQIKLVVWNSSSLLSLLTTIIITLIWSYKTFFAATMQFGSWSCSLSRSSHLGPPSNHMYNTLNNVLVFKKEAESKVGHTTLHICCLLINFTRESYFKQNEQK